MKLIIVILSYLLCLRAGATSGFEVSNLLCDNFIIIKVTPQALTKEVDLSKGDEVLAYGDGFLIRNCVKVEELIYISPLYCIQKAFKFDITIDDLDIKNVYTYGRNILNTIGYTNAFTSKDEHFILIKLLRVGSNIIYKIERIFKDKEQQKEMFSVIENRKKRDVKLMENFVKSIDIDEMNHLKN